MTINGTEYNGTAAIMNGQCNATFNSVIGLDEIAAFGDKPTINGSPMNKLIYVNYEDEGRTHAGWKAETEAEKANGKLDRVKAAIQALGTGLPTISEYIEFLRAVKEAIGDE